jgi:NAD(P)-dependent dehydrogenase (short-subunit alcohol dehydrogenase family)/alkylhydroperoxidase family enzyme
MEGAQPRIGPGGRGDVGSLNALIAAAGGRVQGTRPLNLFATLGRHPRLFRPWLRFAAALTVRGVLPAPERELVILRVAHNCSSAYEWAHHERLARRAGLSAAEVERVRAGARGDGWGERQALLIEAADELHAQRAIGEALWARLSRSFGETELIELCMLVGHYEMIAMTIASLGIQPDLPAAAPAERPALPAGGGVAADDPPQWRHPAAIVTRERDAAQPLAGRRILITGAARGIGAALARRLHARGARLALLGIEPELLASVARECGDAVAIPCDVRERAQVDAAIAQAAEQLSGLDVVVANAGVAAQLPLLGGDPAVFEQTVAVNLTGVYYTLRAAGPHVAHPGGYALAVSSLAAALHPPLLGAYSASKAGVEALADALRIELAGSGARVGVAYFAELDTDMTRRGFGTRAASAMRLAGPLSRVTPLDRGLDAIERGILRRSRHVVAPGWISPLLPARMLVQRLVDRSAQRGLARALAIAREENAPLTTEQPAVAAGRKAPSTRRRPARRTAASTGRSAKGKAAPAQAQEGQAAERQPTAGQERAAARQPAAEPEQDAARQQPASR